MPDGKIQNGQTLLLDLGKPQSLKWAVDVVGGLVRDYKIDWYEEDFNIEPNPYLETADKPDRLGMNEMRFVEGHFAFWDALCKKLPESGNSQLCQRRTANRSGNDSTRANLFGEATITVFPRQLPSQHRITVMAFSHWLPIQGEHDSRVVALRQV